MGSGDGGLARGKGKRGRRPPKKKKEGEQRVSYCRRNTPPWKEATAHIVALARLRFNMAMELNNSSSPPHTTSPHHPFSSLEVGWGSSPHLPLHHIERLALRRLRGEAEGRQRVGEGRERVSRPHFPLDGGVPVLRGCSRMRQIFLGIGYGKTSQQHTCVHALALLGQPQNARFEHGSEPGTILSVILFSKNSAASKFRLAPSTYLS